MTVSHIYKRFFKNGISRKKIVKMLGAMVFGLLVLSTAVDQPREGKPTEGVAEKEVSSSTTSKVIKVVDGDTVTVETNGVRETIRIIGINTPETVDPRRPVECFGQEASTRAHELLDNQTVTLEADLTQGERDKYGRFLRYVFLQNGSDFGKQMISEGYAYEYTYSTPYTYQQDYKASQSDAENAGRGLWADGACEGVQGDSGMLHEVMIAT